MCIEIELLGYLFIFELSALGDKDKLNKKIFVLYIIGEQNLTTDTSGTKSFWLKHMNVLFLQSVQGFVIGISEVEKSLFYHANIFYSESS